MHRLKQPKQPAAAAVTDADTDAGSSQAADSTSCKPYCTTPKRHYTIAPRIGRSGNGAATIWSALEEAAFQAPGQVQAHRGFPGPLRSSLLFLVGNRHHIGPRSGGLLPQARMGRRPAPSVVLPQPRVGRRDSLFDDSELEAGGEQTTGGQQEVAMAAMSDNAALNEAVEALINS